MKFEFDGVTVTNMNALQGAVNTMSVNPLVNSFQVNQNQTQTENGCQTYVSSLDANLDLFYMLGVTSGVDIESMFSKAFSEDKAIAVRVLQHARDCRGGKGRRDVYIKLFKQLITMDKSLAVKVLNNAANIGRFKDIFEMAFNTVLEKDALKLLSSELNKGNSNCAKWCPRKGEDANKLRKWMKLTPKEYRAMLVKLTSAMGVVEQKMCANEWHAINYSAVPSIAAMRYQSAFNKHDEVGYSAFKEKLKTGEVTVNSDTIWPHQLVENVRLQKGDAEVLDAQWNALPNYCQSKENMLALVDVSGSMESNGVMHMAIALGLYLAERTQGAFNKHFLTFSDTPYLDTVKGVNLTEKVRNMANAHWSGSTDIEKAFDVMLKNAVKWQIPAKDMPSILVILSDMEFNKATIADQTMFERVAEMYANAGYALPKIIFWNLCARAHKVPVNKNAQNVALVGGFSPSIMKSVLNADDFSPVKIMIDTVMSDRYVS